MTHPLGFDIEINQHYQDIFETGLVTDYAGTQETTISFDGTNTFTLAPTGTVWHYYRNGAKYEVVGSKTVVLSGSPPAAADIYYIYIDSTDGSLTANTIPWTLEDTKVPVASVVWDNTMTPKYWLSDERHSCAFPARVHWEHHYTDGTQVITLPVLTGPNVTPPSPANTDNIFSLSAGVIADEDIKHTLAALAMPDGSTAAYEIFYRTSGSTWGWTASNVPYKYGTYMQYDNNGTMTDIANGDYTNTYLLLTNHSGSARFAMLHSQAKYSTLAGAQAEVFTSLLKTGLTIDEYVAIYQFTWQANASYSTSGKVRLAVAPEPISISASGASTGVSITWGTIAGTLSNQTDLQAALDSKVTSSSGSANYLARWLSGSSIGNSLLYDTGAAIGLGTTTPGTLLETLGGVVYISSAQNIHGSSGLILGGTDANGNYIIDAQVTGGATGPGNINMMSGKGWLGVNVNPSELFHVGGNVRADGDYKGYKSGSSAILLATSGSIGYINGSLGASAGTSNRFGIGTNNPSSTLEVWSSIVGEGIRAINTAALSSSSGGALWGLANTVPSAADQQLGYAALGALPASGSSLVASALIGAFSGAAWAGGSSYPTYLSFQTIGTGETSRSERMRISPEGLVGIGGTPTLQTLELRSSTYAKGLLATSTYSLDKSSSGGVSWITAGYIPNGADQRFGVMGFGALQNSSGSSWNISSAIVGYSGSAWADGVDLSSYLSFQVTPTGSASRAEAMRLTTAGRLGINYTTPVGMLHARTVNAYKNSMLIISNEESGKYGACYIQSYAPAIVFNGVPDGNGNVVSLDANQYSTFLTQNPTTGVLSFYSSASSGSAGGGNFSYTQRVQIGLTGDLYFTSVRQSTPLGARVRRSTTQSVNTSSVTAITYDTEIADTDNCFTASDSKIYASTAGYYSAGMSIRYPNTSNNVAAYIAVFLRMSGSAFLSAQSQTVTGTGTNVDLSTSADFVYMAVGDYMEYCVFQTSGSAKNFNAAADNNSQQTNSAWLYRIS